MDFELFLRTGHWAAPPNSSLQGYSDAFGAVNDGCNLSATITFLDQSMWSSGAMFTAIRQRFPAPPPSWTLLQKM